MSKPNWKELLKQTVEVQALAFKTHFSYIYDYWKKDWELNKMRTCFICEKKADIGHEINLYPHCTKCYRLYYKKLEVEK